MATSLAVALAVGCGIAALAWLGVLLDPIRAWRLRPVAEEERPPPDPASWPSVRVIIPAHNEAAILGETLSATLAQDYQGDWSIVLVDERSTDHTYDVARQESDDPSAGKRLTVVSGAPLPPGWIGKVWGLEQGLEAFDRAEVDYFLLTDADILHGRASLSALVAESEHQQLALNSRMARLHCASSAEKALIPAFVFFFNLLYPMRRVNDPDASIAAAAGGCVLVRAEALRAIGGFERIRGEVIDDVNLAREIKATGGRLRLALSRREVRSVRRYESIWPIWRMVRRTAFDELGYSWLKLAGTTLGMLILFPLPAAALALSASLGGARAAGLATVSIAQLSLVGSLSLAALLMMRVSYGPAVRLFGLGRAWSWTLPFAGAVYGLVTLDSARRHLAGRSGHW